MGLLGLLEILGLIWFWGLLYQGETCLRANIVDNILNSNVIILDFVVNHLKLIEFLLYLARRIYVRIIRKQQHQNLYESFFRCYTSWGKTALHTKRIWNKYAWFYALMS